jgi:hypothetical protein
VIRGQAGVHVGVNTCLGASPGACATELPMGFAGLFLGLDGRVRAFGIRSLAGIPCGFYWLLLARNQAGGGIPYCLEASTGERMK